MRRPAVISHTVETTDRWLAQIADQLGHGDASSAYAALRAVLHGLRDRLPVNEMADLGAQLPLLLRGTLYEGWSPAKARPAGRHEEDFLFDLTARLRGHDELGDPRNVAIAVFSVIDSHVTEGEVADVRASLPRDIRALWPDGRE